MENGKCEMENGMSSAEDLSGVALAKTDGRFKN
jgi:hypothetical protein